jgi:hypothetical protein
MSKLAATTLLAVFGGDNRYLLRHLERSTAYDTHAYQLIDIALEVVLACRIPNRRARCDHPLD